MNFRIRTATAADVPAMHRVRNDVRENRLSNPQRISEASYLPYIAEGSAWVAETEKGIVGFAAVDLSSGSLWALFVAPDAEGAGIGRALHDCMLEWAIQKGVQELWLSTSPGTRAERFYTTGGWQNAGLTDKGEIRLKKPLTG